MPRDASQSAQTGARVLVVDDEPVVRRVTATALLRFGYSVVEAPNGNDGIRMCEQYAGALDLLLSDMEMGEVSGFEVAVAFRRHNPGRPVIFTSGYSDEGMLARIRSEGAAFLLKPYDIQGLANAVREALEATRRREVPPREESC